MAPQPDYRKFDLNRNSIESLRKTAKKPGELQLAIDCETLSLRPNAVVVSIGWCLFEFDGTINAAGVIYPSMDEQLALGRDVDISTVQWWMKQEDAARDALLVEGRVSVRDAMTELAKLTELVEGVWGYGADSDNVWPDRVGVAHRAQDDATSQAHGFIAASKMVRGEA